MKMLEKLEIRDVVKKDGTVQRHRFGLFLCPVCGGEAERKTHDGLKQKRCCGGSSKIARKGTPLHNTYIGMTQRCWDKNATSYRNYGGRGVEVCQSWRNFDNFAKWAIKSGFHPGLQIDRINNDGNYEPTNCRFVTPRENCTNKRTNIHTEKDIERLIYDYVTTFITSKELAIKYNDSQGNINNILNKRTWDIKTKYDSFIPEATYLRKSISADHRKLWNGRQIL
jgi:hypothetical protein